MINIREKLAAPPTYRNYGQIPNPNGFSETCSAIFNQGNIDQRIRWTSFTGYILDDVPPQFHPAILQAVDIHQSDHSFNRRCWLHLDQGLLPIGQNFRKIGPHFDAWSETYPHSDYPNNDVFIVSDVGALVTQFSLQSYDLPEVIAGTGKYLNNNINHELEKQLCEDHIVSPRAYDLVRCDSFTVHRAQIPQEPTKRGFLMVRFF